MEITTGYAGSFPTMAEQSMSFTGKGLPVKPTNYSNKGQRKMAKPNHKTKAGRPRLYEFPTVRIMVTIPASDKKDVQDYARAKMVAALINQSREQKSERT